MAGDGGMWPIIGIDLGTTNSCVAVWHDGRVEIISNELGNRTTPSVVSFTEYGRLIGEDATNQASKNVENTIFDVKRLIGRRFSDDFVKQDTTLWPFKVIDGVIDGDDLRKRDQPMIVVNYMGKEIKFTPEEITAMTLAKMKGVAEAFLGCSVKNAVITVPSHFNSSQRQATKDAGAIAGLNVIRLLNETSAAAIPYTLDIEVNKTGNAKKNVLMFHLGGGTFDVSLVEIEKGAIRVKSTYGNSHLGGTDFDNNIVCDFEKEFNKQNHEKHDISKNLRALAKLRVASEKAKRELSVLTEAEVEIDCLFDGIDFSSSITRAHFEDLNEMLFLEFTCAIDQCLEVACVKKVDVHDVILIGGSSRVPKVRKMLEDYFLGKELCRSIHPEEAAASGAAMYAAMLCGRFTKNKDIELEDITPFSLYIDHNRCGIKYHIHTWNRPIPMREVNKIYFGCRSNYMLEVFEEKKSEYNFVSKLVIPSAPEWNDNSITVYVDIDENGILDVSVEKPSLWNTWYCRKNSIQKWNGRLLREDIQRMIEDAEYYKNEDEERKRLLQNKSSLESNAYATLERLDDIGNNNNEEKEQIKEAITKMLESMEQMSDLSEIPSLDQRLGELRKRVEELHYQDKTPIIEEFLDSYTVFV